MPIFVWVFGLREIWAANIIISTIIISKQICFSLLWLETLLLNKHNVEYHTSRGPCIFKAIDRNFSS